MANPLEDQIKSALRSSSRLKDVIAVIALTEWARDHADKLASAAQERSVDPALTTADARIARNDAADHEHDARRLNASLELLQARRKKILDDDSYAKRQARYDAAKAERDALANELSERFPAIAAELVRLALRIQASDAECSKVNADRPRGQDALVIAEALARGTNSMFTGRQVGTRLARITEMQIPIFHADDVGPVTNLVWPPAEHLGHAAVMGAAFASVEGAHTRYQNA